MSKFFSSLILTLLLIPQVGFASMSEELLNLQAHIEKQVNPVVKRLDPQAVVIVKITPKKSVNKVQLPATPFFITGTTSEVEGDELKISSIDIKIYSALKAFPKDVTDFIEDTVSHTGVKPNVRAVQLPDGLLPGSLPISNQFQNWKSQLDFGELLFSLLLSLAVLVGGVFFVYRARHSTQLTSTLEGGLSQLAKVLEETGGNSSQMSSDLLAAKSNIQASSGGSQDQKIKTIENLPLEGILALLSDCYWAKQDSYACFLWKRIPIETRKVLLGKTPFMADFVSSIQELEEEDLGYEQESYYLEPYKINHLSNEDLTRVVKQYPFLLDSLSFLRSENIQLGLSERIKLSHESKDHEEPVAPDFASIKPSQLRFLRKRTKIRIQSIEQEREALSLPNLPIEYKMGIPSLGWLLELKEEYIQEIFSKFSARDLAMAWVGPEEVLEKLSKHIGAKKKDLMDSYLKNIKASRNSPVFLAIHMAAMDRLNPQEDAGSSGYGSQKAA